MADVQVRLEVTVSGPAFNAGAVGEFAADHAEVAAAVQRACLVGNADFARKVAAGDQKREIGGCGFFRGEEDDAVLEAAVGDVHRDLRAGRHLTCAADLNGFFKAAAGDADFARLCGSAGSGVAAEDALPGTAADRQFTARIRG